MKFAVLSNLVIRSFFIFVIAYLWASYLFRGFFVNFLIAFLITVLANYFITILYTKKRNKVNLTKQEQEHMFKISLAYRFMTKEKALENLYLVFGKLNEDGVEKQYDRVLVDGKSYFSMLHKDVSIEDVVEIVRKADFQKVVVVGQEFSREVRNFFGILEIDVELLNIEKFYSEYLKKAEIFPNLSIATKSKSRITWLGIRNMFLQRQKARGYVLVGLVVLMASFVVSFSLFYIIFATFLFGLAVTSRVINV
ncbi:MAG: hypothetical protein FWE16_04610 [Firmicutes bacterium]|nr:hypothetical protein [Bacillota bacterium]